MEMTSLMATAVAAAVIYRNNSIQSFEMSFHPKGLLLFNIHTNTHNYVQFKNLNQPCGNRIAGNGVYC